MLDSTETDPFELPEKEGGAGAEAGKRASPDRSSIAFPYTHLEDAITVAQAIRGAGTSLSRAQIAGVMGTEPTNGSFSLRVGAARTFRLIDAIEGKYDLSELGEDILSPDEGVARRARRDAFLCVELYQKTYETFRSRMLPPRPAGLENAFVSFGVAPKQKDKARLAFERSAQFAGFFHAGKERLVEPIIASPSQNGRATTDVPADAKATEAPIVNPLPAAAQQPLIKGLLERLPAPDTKWTLAERARWLRALSVNLAMIYGENDEAEITIQAPSKAAALVAKADPSRSVTKPAAASSEASKGADLDDDIPF